VAGHCAWVGQAEVRDALEPRFEGDPEFHAGQMGPNATVDAEAERGVPVGLTVDDDLTRPVELGRVTVGGRERQQDPVVGLHVGSVPVHILLDQPGHGDRRVGPEEFLHRGRQQPGTGSEPRAVPGGLGQMPQGRADRAPGRVDAGDQQQGHRADDVRGIEPVTVQFGVDQVAGEVLARVLEVVAYLCLQVVEQPADPLDAFLRRPVDALQQVLDELPELWPVLRRKTQHVGDDPYRDVLRVFGSGVDDVPVPELVDE
jgi:hypothetical protein